MRGWAKKWWLVCVLIGAAILILAWGVRCEHQVAKCRADYAAQESRAYGFSVNGNAAEQEAINAACEPSDYFCRLFSSANFPTWLLVLIGIGGIWAAVSTLRAIESQARTMNQEFVASHRPRLRVRRLTIKSGTQINKPTIEVANVGDTSAFIVASHFQFMVCPNVTEAMSRFDDRIPNNPFPPVEVIGGESIDKIELPFDDEMKATHFKTELLTAGKNAVGVLYAIGWVQYGDNNNTLRKTGFCRWRDPESGLFLLTKESAVGYEYED